MVQTSQTLAETRETSLRLMMGNTAPALRRLARVGPKWLLAERRQADRTGVLRSRHTQTVAASRRGLLRGRGVSIRHVEETIDRRLVLVLRLGLRMMLLVVQGRLDGVARWNIVSRSIVVQSRLLVSERLARMMLLRQRRQRRGIRHSILLLHLLLLLLRRDMVEIHGQRVVAPNIEDRGRRDVLEVLAARPIRSWSGRKSPPSWAGLRASLVLIAIEAERR